MLSRAIACVCILACTAEESAHSLLRGSTTSAPSSQAVELSPSAGEEPQHIGCTCSIEKKCQCSRSNATREGNEEDAALEQLLLSRTQELSSWWQEQNETMKLVPW